MRSLLYTLVTFLSITSAVCHIPFSAVAQNDITKDIYLKRSRDTRSKIFLGQSIKEAIPALGKPDKIKDYYFEADEKTGNFIIMDKVMSSSWMTSLIVFTFPTPHL